MIETNCYENKFSGHHPAVWITCSWKRFFLALLSLLQSFQCRSLYIIYFLSITYFLLYDKDVWEYIFKLWKVVGVWSVTNVTLRIPWQRVERKTLMLMPTRIPQSAEAHWLIHWTVEPAVYVAMLLTTREHVRIWLSSCCFLFILINVFSCETDCFVLFWKKKLFRQYVKK
jgi:hypothetical protein